MNSRPPLSVIFWALMLSVHVAGCGRPNDSETSTDVPSKPSPPAPAPALLPLDIQAQANRSLADYQGLPTGLQSLQGVNYQIGPNLLQLGGRANTNFPKEIPGIPIGQVCQAIHFLHASQGGAYQQSGHPKHEDDGVEIGRYVVHYEDGSQEFLPIIYGQDLRDWWDWDDNRPTTKSNMVWTGDNPKAGQYNRKIRLYWAVWENPHPEKPLATIDFVSANANAAPFCVAMTVESPSSAGTP